MVVEVTTATASRLPRRGEVAVRQTPALLKHGIRNCRTAVREFRAALDLGPLAAPDLVAKERLRRRGLILARLGQVVFVVWVIGAVAAVWLGGWSWLPVVALVVLGVAVFGARWFWPVAIYLTTGAKVPFRKDPGPLAFLTLPTYLVVGSWIVWLHAGWWLPIVLGVETVLAVIAGMVALVGFAWSDGSVLDNLGITPRPHLITPDLVQAAIASAVLGAKGPKVLELAQSVRLSTPIMALPGGGWRTTVELPDATIATDAVKKAAGIASYLEIDAGWLVVSQGAHDGQIDLTAYDHDPYEGGGDHCPLAATPARTSVWDPIRLGRTLTGDPVTITLAYSGVLIGGRPRVGKTVALLDILAHVLCDPDCDVMIGDGKEVDTWAVRDLATVYVGADPDAFSRMLEGLLARIDTARATLRGVGKRLTRENAATSGIRPAVLLVDELAYFTRPVQARHREVAEVIVDQLARIVEYGPAFGVWVVLATQYPRGDVIDARIRQIPVRVALPTADRLASDLILGEGSNARGHRSHLFPATTTGVAVVKAAAVQTTVVDYFDAEDDLTRIAAYAGALRGELGALPAPRVVPEILERAVAVFEALGVDRLPSSTLADRLGYDSPEALADVLRPLGVRPKKYRDGKSTARGYLAADLGATVPRNDRATTPPQVVERSGATVIQFPRVPGSFRGDVPYHDVSGSDV